MASVRSSKQALWGDVNEVEVAVEYGLFDGLRLLPVERRIEDGGFDAELGQGVDLVLHQRDQRRDDDGAAGAEQGGNLVAEALAAAGRHQDQGIAAAGDMVDDLGLGAAEGRVAEDVAQEVAEERWQMLRSARNFAQFSKTMASRFRRSPSQTRHSPRSSCQSASTQRSTWMPSTMWSCVAAWCVWP
jgi:hypothetical protein